MGYGRMVMVVALVAFAAASCGDPEPTTGNDAGAAGDGGQDAPASADGGEDAMVPDDAGADDAASGDGAVLPPPPPPGAWVPPIGIPHPGFGIEEQPGDRPDPWTEETPGWYFVQHDHPEASDRRTYGTPEAPRATIPDPIPAGSVVVLAGTYSFAPTGYDRIEAEGTAEAPVFILGEPGAVVTAKWQIVSTYLIVDGIEFTDRGRIEIRYPSHHVVLRNGEHHHIQGKIGGSGRGDEERIHHIVIYRNRIHSQDGWNENPSEDLDNHGIKFGHYTEDVWVIDNIGYNNAGDFIQVGDYGDGSTDSLNRSRRFYIGRNEVYANRQSPVGIKQATDVIVSQNTFHTNHRVQTNSAGSSGIYFLYGPEYVWIIYNRIYDSNAGVTAGSNSGGTGQYQFIIGNVIYDITAAPDYDYRPSTGWAPAAIMLAGGSNRYVVNNTIWDAEGGIHTPSSNPIHIAGNIIANVKRGRHVFIEMNDGLGASSMRDNLLFQSDGPIRVRWGSSSYEDLAALEAAHDGVSGNVEADPRLRDPAAGDLRPTASSPAVDATTEHDVYRIFMERYGLDIRLDADGNARPAGAGWDRGAYEYVTE